MKISVKIRKELTKSVCILGSSRQPLETRTRWYILVLSGMHVLQIWVYRVTSYLPNTKHTPKRPKRPAVSQTLNIRQKEIKGIYGYKTLEQEKNNRNPVWGKRIISEIKKFWIQFPNELLLAKWPWENNLPSISVCFHICKMEIILYTW